MQNCGYVCGTVNQDGVGVELGLRHSDCDAEQSVERTADLFPIVMDDVTIEW